MDKQIQRTMNLPYNLLVRANPGGLLAPDEVVGRDPLIANLWRILERQSVILTAERRIGKTCVVKKMATETPNGVIAVYHDLEAVSTPLELAERLLHDVEGFLSPLNRSAVRVRRLLSQLKGAEVADVIKLPEVAAPHWKVLLVQTLEDLTDNQEKRVVFFWDELPYMLLKIAQREGETVAMEVLDVLRSLRHTFSGVRFVFTGSIGLHNVLQTLHTAGYANSSTNDMVSVGVSPLTPADAQALARELLVGEAIRCTDLEATATAIGTAVDGIPYLIHHVVDSIATGAAAVTPASVQDLVSSRLADPNDPWDLRHFIDRLATYYPSDRGVAALRLLDSVAAGNDGGSEEALCGIGGPATEAMHDILNCLERDHYLVRDASGRYRFRFPLLRRYWRLARRLSE